MKNRLRSILTIPHENAASVLPPAELELLRQAIRSAEQQLDQVCREKKATSKDEGIPKDGCLDEAEAIARTAQADCSKLWEAHKRMPGMVRPSELESSHLIAELAKLRLAEARADTFRSAFSRVQSQLKELGDEVRRLRERVETLSRRN